MGIIAAVLSAVLPVPGSAQRRPTTVATAFINVSVVPMDREHVLEGQTVVVQDGRIAAIGPVKRVRVPAGAIRIDGRGKFLIPGLADMHFHLGHVSDSARTEQFLLLLLAHGVTTIRNMDWWPLYHNDKEQLLRLRSQAASGALLVPRIYTSGPWQLDPRGVSAGFHLASPADAFRLLTEYKAAGYDFVKLHGAEDRETFDSVTAAARRIGIPVVGHIPPNVTLDQAIAAGYRSLEHLYGVFPAVADSVIKSGLSGIDEAALDTVPIPALMTIAGLVAHAGIWNCPTQALADYSAGTGSFMSSGEGIQDLGNMVKLGPKKVVTLRRRIIKALQEAGAGLLLGTDQTPDSSFQDLSDLSPDVRTAWQQRPVISVHDELLALVRAGLTPYQALATGTRNPALYFGTSSESGTIAAGKWADLVLLNGNPLTDIRNTTQIAGVMRSGHWLSRAELDRRLAATIDSVALSRWWTFH